MFCMFKCLCMSVRPRSLLPNNNKSFSLNVLFTYLSYLLNEMSMLGGIITASELATLLG